MLFGEIGQIYHLSPDNGIAVRNVVKTICAKMKVDFNNLTKVTQERLGQDAAYVIDSEKARNRFRWKPQISFEDGIDGVIKWIEDNWEEIQNQPLDYIHKP